MVREERERASERERDRERERERREERKSRLRCEGGEACVRESHLDPGRRFGLPFASIEDDQIRHDS